MPCRAGTLSICEFVEGNFSVTDPAWPFPKNFDGLSQDDKDKILNYELMVYECVGTEDEKLEWFKVINIAGLKLEDQELRNAVYTGPWLTDAKRYFSRVGQGADRYAKGYVNPGDVKAQALLEKALTWVAGRGDENICNYMNAHRADPHALELWNRFRDVVDWAKATFPKVRTPLKSVNWPDLYDRFGTRVLDPASLEVEVSRLLADPDVTKKPGVYEYVLSGDARAAPSRLTCVTRGMTVESPTFLTSAPMLVRYGRRYRSARHQSANAYAPTTASTRSAAGTCQ